MSVQFSDQQARTVAAAITTASALVILLVIGLIGWLASLFLNYFSGLFLPLAVGAIAALVCRPYYEWLGERLRLPVAGAVAVVILSALLPLTAFALFFGQIALAEIEELLANYPRWWDNTRSWIEDRIPRLTDFLQTSGLDARLQQAVEAQQAAILSALRQIGSQAFTAGMGIAQAIATLVGWFVVPIYFVYFLTARGLRVDTSHLLPFLKPETRADAEYLMHEFVDIIVAFFRGQLVVALLQGLLYAAGFSAVGLRYGFVIGLLLGLLNVIPYLGAIVGLGIAIPTSLIQDGGGLLLCGLTLGVFAFVQFVEGWFLTPKIMGDRTGLHFMAIIVAVFFWGTALGGILGMILAIPLTAFLASLWRLARDKYIPEII